MTDLRKAQASGLPAKITSSLATLWTRYAGNPPSDVRTELRGDVVTCVLVDAVDAFERQLGRPATQEDPAGESGTLASYKSEAVETIVRLTRQRVSSFVSSHDRETDVATEIFTLEPPPLWQSRRRDGVRRARRPASIGRDPGREGTER
jgi:Na+-translocating membrane potential-generating system (MpsC)